MLVVLMGWVFPPSIAASAKPITSSVEMSNQVIERLNDNLLSTSIQEHARTVPVPKRQANKAKSASAYSGRNYSKEEVILLIKDYSAQYGISADLPLRVALCESGYTGSAKNKNSTASGVFQYIASTWRHTEAGLTGLSPFDADANVHMAIKSIASGGISNWAASKGCWNHG